MPQNRTLQRIDSAVGGIGNGGIVVIDGHQPQQPDCLQSGSLKPVEVDRVSIGEENNVAHSIPRASRRGPDGRGVRSLVDSKAAVLAGGDDEGHRLSPVVHLGKMYSGELPMSHPIQARKTTPPLCVGTFRLMQADALRRDLHDRRSPAKRLASDLDVCLSTAKSYMTGLTELPGAKLLTLAAKGYQNVRALVIEQLGLPDEITLQQELDGLRVRLTRLEAHYKGKTNAPMVRATDGTCSSETGDGTR